ncbi:MAG: hypothetical protein A2284_17080 [Deltaproteobacteria bacterium RIFOXYA12_FULL_61_11]|nr:MAG: hypothetical protein A2284_17080 [Deltaproteobacteria bacterium RIFOXYA12_FULL_61_11]
MGGGFLLFLLPLFSVAQGFEVPAYRGYVNDQADLISDHVERQLERLLQSFDESDSTQVAVLTLPSLGGIPIEEASLQVAEKWGIGRRGKDNGVLLLVGREERRMRLEVGRGLEATLTDLLAGRIIDQVLTPAFREGRYDEGFQRAIGAVIAATRGEYQADPRPRGARGTPGISSYLIFFGILVIFLGVLGRVARLLGGALLLPVMTYLGSAGSVVWWVLLLLIPAGALLGMVLPLFLAGTHRYGHRGMPLGGLPGGMLGLGGGRSFGGSSGFGGFGGGRFGGGGASGGW